MAGPVLTSFKLPSTSVSHTAKKKKKDCFSKNVYVLIVEVCSYPAQPFKHEEFERPSGMDGWMDAGGFNSCERCKLLASSLSSG